MLEVIELRVRLKQGCPYDKMTVNENGHAITVTRNWIEIPNNGFFRHEMEIEGQEQPVQIQATSEKTKELEPLKEKVEEPKKPITRLRTRK